MDVAVRNEQFGIVRARYPRPCWSMSPANNPNSFHR